DSWSRPIGLTFAPLIDSWSRPIGLTFALLIEPWLPGGTEGVLLKIRPTRGWASASKKQSGGVGASDLLRQDVQPQKASAHPRNYPKTRRTAPGLYFLPPHIHECCAPFRFRPGAAEERAPSRYGS